MLSPHFRKIIYSFPPVRTKRTAYNTFTTTHTITSLSNIYFDYNKIFMIIITAFNIRFHLTFIKLNSLVNDYFFDNFPEFFHNAYHLFSVYNYIIYFRINRDISWGRFVFFLLSLSLFCL